MTESTRIWTTWFCNTTVKIWWTLVSQRAVLYNGCGISWDLSSYREWGFYFYPRAWKFFVLVWVAMDGITLRGSCCAGTLMDELRHSFLVWTVMVNLPILLNYLSDGLILYLFLFLLGLKCYGESARPSEWHKWWTLSLPLSVPSWSEVVRWICQTFSIAYVVGSISTSLYSFLVWSITVNLAILLNSLSNEANIYLFLFLLGLNC